MALLNRSASQSIPPRIAEDEELVTPAPSIAHPTAGAIPRKDMETIRASNRVMFQGITEQANGTVTASPSHPVSTVSTPAGGGFAAGGPATPEQDKEANEWEGLFKGSLNAKGMPLGFVAPKICDGKPVVQLQKAEVDKGSCKWASAIVFYVIGYKPTIAAVSRYIEQNWNHVSKPDVFLHEEGFFVIRFASIDDMHSIFYSGPHMFYGKPTVVKLRLGLLLFLSMLKY